MPTTLTFLGTGTSAGVPVIACDCEVCTSDDPRDHRDRPGVMIEYHDFAGDHRRYLIDTTPDLRHQMIRHNVMHINGVVYTHNHADHVFGIDDLRRFNAVMDAHIDIHAEQNVIDWLHHTFEYIFRPHKNINKSFVPRLLSNVIQHDEPFTLSDIVWQPIRLMHGRLPILGYRVNDIAYCTDVSSIPPESWEHLENLDILVIDALRYRHHPTHLTIDQALEIINQVQPRKAYLTHISHEVSHAKLVDQLPDNVAPAYDGLTLTLHEDGQVIESTPD